MTAAELITSLPSRLKRGEGTGINIVYHFKISGPRGGDFTVTVNDGVCKAEAGLHGEPKCVVEAADTDYEDVEYGRTNAQMAVLLGTVKVSNIASMLKFVGMFDRVS